MVIEFHVAIVLCKGAVENLRTCGHQGIAAVGVEHRVVDECLASALADGHGRERRFAINLGLHTIEAETALADGELVVQEV